jgi:hypothetical protein
LSARAPKFKPVLEKKRGWGLKYSRISGILEAMGRQWCINA